MKVDLPPSNKLWMIINTINSIIIMMALKNLTLNYLISPETTNSLDTTVEFNSYGDDIKTFLGKHKLPKSQQEFLLQEALRSRRTTPRDDENSDDDNRSPTKNLNPNPVSKTAERRYESDSSDDDGNVAEIADEEENDYLPEKLLDDEEDTGYDADDYRSIGTTSQGAQSSSSSLTSSSATRDEIMRQIEADDMNLNQKRGMSRSLRSDLSTVTEEFADNSKNTSAKKTVTSVRNSKRPTSTSREMFGDKLETQILQRKKLRQYLNLS